jgi:Cu/Ag efflux pump CusA
MATLAVTVAGHSGSRLRRMAQQIEKCAIDVPDVVATGASVVLTIDNTANTVQITAGGYTSVARPF